jgi:hypothetical protein
MELEFEYDVGKRMRVPGSKKVDCTKNEREG